MGLLMWCVAGFAAAAIARLSAPGRTERWVTEGFAATASAVICGFVATALDFGGLKEPDWRAGSFALAGAALAIALLRLRSLTARPRG
jgi:hypothetical protein